MPYVDPSWRIESLAWRWLSRTLCFFRKHHWLKSSRTHERLMCVICRKTTALWHERMKKHSGK